MKEQAKEIFLEAIDKNRPSRLIDRTVTLQDDGFLIRDQHFSIQNRPIFLIAAGKASEEMASALQKKFNIDDENAVCIARENDAQEEKSNIIYASHPYPDAKSEKAAEALIQFIKSIPAKAIVLFAISGGMSALVSKPAEGISIDEVREVNKMLLNSGASIHQINAVRKHLSAVKGGRLLTYFQPDITLVNFMISDVPGDDPEIIGSGPTVADSTTFQDAYHVLLEYDLWKDIPNAVRNYIEKGAAGGVQETPKQNDKIIQNHHTFIIGSARKFAETMAETAEGKGYKPKIAENYYNMSVDKLIDKVVAELKEANEGESKAFIYYGESTLNVTGKGMGGRNQAMALRAAKKINGMKNTVWLSADTDGNDGPTDAAGAIVDGNTMDEAKKRGINPDIFIEENNAYRFHEKLGTIFKTGSTGNNLMDVVLVLSSES